MILLKVEGRRLRLNRSLFHWIQGQRTVAAFLEGDTVVLKRFRRATAYSFLAKDRPISLREINAEVHRSRRPKR
jgi:hypothetical protein